MTKSLIVREGRTELESELGEKPLVFVYPARGPGTYANVAQAVTEAGLTLPRGPETASLVGAAFSDLNNRYSKEIKQTLDNRWLWVFTRNLYMPEKGIYLYDGVQKLNESGLVKKLEAGDKSVRFVPFGFKTEEQTASNFAKNPYVVVLFGEEGAEKLAKASKKYSRNPAVWTIPANDVREPIQRVSSLDGYGSGRLSVGGGDFGGCDGGCAFGVSETSAEGASIAENKQGEAK